MSLPQPKPELLFSWADYQTWPEGERWEIIGGAAFAMSPSPNTRHQEIAGALFIQLSTALKGRTCRPFIAPLDLKLSESDVVQPDLMVVCNPSQIKATHIEGVPTLVIEVLSPSSHFHDRARKMALYARHGAKEYWLVTPYPPLLEIYVLDDGGYYFHGGYRPTDIVASKVFPDMSIDLAAVFDVFYSEDEMALFEVRESPAPYPAKQHAPTTSVDNIGSINP